MVEFFFLILGLSLVVYLTVLFLISLGNKKGSTRSKIWNWIKNVIDAVSGIDRDPEEQSLPLCVSVSRPSLSI